VSTSRRRFLKRCLAGAGIAVLGPKAVSELVLETTEPGLGLGFRNDAPARLGRFSRPAAFAVASGRDVRCELCPHECVLGENDRGFCRTRVVKGGRLHTVAYGNACTIALDPIEKKPLYHFLPRQPILSVATGGCNLRCLNCQNWEISQKRPEDVQEQEAMPADLVAAALRDRIPLLAFTYSEPLVFYEYVRDTAALAHDRGLRNVLVTAGYINPEPLRALARVIDAVTLDLKAFDEALFRDLAGGRLRPVLRGLEILREEGVWTEVSFLMVPTLSDSAVQIGHFARWVARTLGPDVPLHVLRFHPAHRLESLPRTPVPALEEARDRALQAGLHHVYLGNVPGHDANHTRCPRCGRTVIERHGFDVTRNDITEGRCPCGTPIAGVWA
jgi:pyruvate formate lyase activating enzyme